MSWRLAKSLTELRRQVNAAWPDRPKQSDGTIGDTAHSARRSDHNPNAAGVVRALDLTAPVGHDVVEAIRRSRDPRVKYLISNGRIASSYAHADGPAWSWRPYSGSNAHTRHAHISVHGSPTLYDDARSWRLGLTAASTPDQEEDMTDEDRKMLREVHAQLTGTNPDTVRGALIGERSGLYAILSKVREIRATQVKR